MIWVLKMAMRDLRRGRGRWFLFMAATTLGIAALVSVASFGANLKATMANEAQVLLGADLRIKSRRAFAPETVEFAENLANEIDAELARRISFHSMAIFEEGTRLVQVRAVDGDYPFYGELLTEPAEAASTYQQSKGALVDDGLLRQYGAEVGDTVQVGSRIYPIAGRLLYVPGLSMAQVLVSPRVYLPRDELDPALLARGSRINHDYFFKLARGLASSQWQELDDHAKTYDVDVDTPADVQRYWGRTLRNVHGYLNLVGFVALILGGVGVASAVHVYVKRKSTSIAVLRCLGASSTQTLAIFAVQALGIGLVGALAGAILGITVQQALPWVLSSFLPLPVDTQFDGNAVLSGMVIGLLVTFVFALLPLVTLRRITPLQAVRASMDPPAMRRDPVVLILAGVLVVAIAMFAYFQTGRLRLALSFTGAIVAVFALLALLARGLLTALRHLSTRGLSYEVRQGIANLHRPDNQTVVLILSMGLTTFLVLCVYLSEQSLLSRITLSEEEQSANLVLFDIQDDQVEPVEQVLARHGLEPLQQVPIVNMRIAAFRGRPVEEIRNDPGNDITSWVLLREYRSTYRQELAPGEVLTEGEWVGEVTPDSGPVPVSLEARIVQRLRASLGDRITFNVQGLEIETEIASIREVEWTRPQPNFFAVFPAGVLEQAPKFHVFTAHTEDSDLSARLQREVVEAFPNISSVDLTLVANVADEILDKASFVLRFMALFSVFTGVVVLVSSLLLSRLQRIEESTLLRTLGAARSQVRKIMALEFLALGTLSTTSGVLLALAGGWALAHFFFETSFRVDLTPVVATFATVTVLTTVIGLFHSRGVCDRPPLEILRAE